MDMLLTLFLNGYTYIHLMVFPWPSSMGCLPRDLRSAAGGAAPGSLFVSVSLTGALSVSVCRNIYTDC